MTSWNGPPDETGQDLISLGYDERPLIRVSPGVAERLRRVGRVAGALGVALLVALPAAFEKPTTPAPAPASLPGTSVSRALPHSAVPVLGGVGWASSQHAQRAAHEIPFTNSAAFITGQARARNHSKVEVEIKTLIPLDYLKLYVEAAHDLKHGAGWEMLAAYADVESAHGLAPQIWNKADIASTWPGGAVGPMQLSEQWIRDTNVNPFDPKQELTLLVSFLNAAGQRIVASGRVPTPELQFEEMGILPSVAKQMADKAHDYTTALPDPGKAHGITIGEIQRVGQAVEQAADGLLPGF